MAKIGPNFANELKAAGLLGYHFSWTADGVEFFPDTPPDIVTRINAVLAAHDPTKPDPALVFADAFANGCAIVSASNPAINGTYGIAMQDQINFTALQSAINAGVPFLGYIRDKSGVKRTMTAAQFTAIAESLLGFVAALDDFVAGQGSQPTQPVNIA